MLAQGSCCMLKPLEFGRGEQSSAEQLAWAPPLFESNGSESEELIRAVRTINKP